MTADLGETSHPTPVHHSPLKTKHGRFLGWISAACRLRLVVKMTTTTTTMKMTMKTTNEHHPTLQQKNQDVHIDDVGFPRFYFHVYKCQNHTNVCVCSVNVRLLCARHSNICAFVSSSVNYLRDQEFFFGQG